MVSAQIAGNVRAVIRAPSGASRPAFNGSVQKLGFGGSSNGSIVSTTTPEKWVFVPLSADAGADGYTLDIYFTPGANATLDISDAVWLIPVVVNGTPETLGNNDNASGMISSNFVKDFLIGDVAVIANTETLLARYRFKSGTFRTGGGTIFMSVEDNA